MHRGGYICLALVNTTKPFFSHCSDFKPSSSVSGPAPPWSTDSSGDCLFSCHFGGYVVVSHCGFSLHFPDD